MKNLAVGAGVMAGALLLTEIYGHHFRDTPQWFVVMPYNFENKLPDSGSERSEPFFYNKNIGGIGASFTSSNTFSIIHKS